MRKITDLNFGWKYSETFSEEMIKPGFDDSSFEKVDIPHTNKELPYNYFDESSFQFVSCYRKVFRVPAEGFEGKKHIFISFEELQTMRRCISTVNLSVSIRVVTLLSPLK